MSYKKFKKNKNKKNKRASMLDSAKSGFGMNLITSKGFPHQSILGPFTEIQPPWPMYTRNFNFASELYCLCLCGPASGPYFDAFLLLCRVERMKKYLKI